MSTGHAVNTRILIVDDDPRILSGLRRMLHSMRSTWDMEFAEGGEQALALLKGGGYDLIMTDMRMPGLDGAALLAEVKAHWPHMARIVLSGNTEYDNRLRSVDLAHQYLSKPCNATDLKNALRRAITQKELITDNNMAAAVAGLDSIPSVPEVYDALVQALDQPEVSMEAVGAIVTSDIGLTARTLQIHFSGYFMQPRHVASPAEAVTLLGVDVLRSLVRSTNAYRPALLSTAVHSQLRELQEHCAEIASHARRVAARIGLPQVKQDEAYLAGLLHDVGLLLLAQIDAKCVERHIGAATSVSGPSLKEERLLLGVDHARAGANLLEVFGLPASIVEAVAFHHEPSTCPNQAHSPLTAVHVAELGMALAKQGREQLPIGGELEYLRLLGIDSIAQDHFTEMFRTTTGHSQR